MAKDLEVRHCRALVAVHDGGGVGAAARALGVAQSTVSETLLSLERLLGTPVTLRRAGREAVLTATAMALLADARALVALSEGALAANATQSRAVIRVGTVESISSFLLPGPLSDFRLLCPNVEVRVTIGLCADLRKRVARSELDLVLTVESADRTPDRDLAEEFWPAMLRLVAAPHNRLAGSIVQRNDLETRTCLLADPEGAFNDLVSSWIANAVRAPRLESAGSIDGVKRGILNSEAIGVLPHYTVAEELSAGTLVALETAPPLPPIALCLATLKAPQAASPLASLTDKIRAGLYRPGGERVVSAT